MAETRSAFLTPPVMQGTPKLSTSALEAAYHAAVRSYSCSTAVPSCTRTQLKGRTFEKELSASFLPLGGRGPSVEVVVPVVSNSSCGIDSVEIGGIITKAKRKIIRCPERCSRTSPVRAVLKSPAEVMCGKCGSSRRGRSTCSTCNEVYRSTTNVARLPPREDTEEVSAHSSYQEVTAVHTKAFCLTDTYTVDDGWGVIVCILKNWISVRNSSPQRAVSGQHANSETYTLGMRHPPHRMGDFVRIRGRLCVKPIEGDSGLELPKDFSRAFLRAAAVCGGRDVQDETNWFAEVYYQLQSNIPVGEVVFGALPSATPLVDHRAGGSARRSARVTV